MRLDVANSSSSAVRSAAAPATLCAPSSSTSGCRPTTSSRPGERTDANPSATTVVGSGAADERLRRRERDRGVVGLMPAVQREVDIGIARFGRREIDDATAERELLREHGEVAVAQQHARRLLREEERCEIGIGLAEHERRTRLDDVGLLRRDAARASVRDTRRGRCATLVTTATRPSTTLVASHVPPRPTSTTATSTARSANHRNAAAVRISK